MSGQAAQETVPGIFATREQAEAAIADLRGLGLTDENIGVAVPDPGRYELIDDSTREALKGLTSGIAIGAPAGALAGIALTSLVLPAAGVVAAGGLFLGVYGGTLWGAFVGAVGGLAAKVRWNDAEDRWCEIPLGGGDILVVARATGRADEARTIMERHGAKCFMDMARPATAAVPPTL